MVRVLVNLLLWVMIGFTKEPEDISDEIASLLKGSYVPSLAAAAVLGGKTVYQGAAGIRKIGDDTRVTINDKYHIGSCTKSMTATLAAILVEDGKLRWDQKLQEVFTDIEIHEGYQKTTLNQLLRNSGGIPGDIDPLLWRELWKAQGSKQDQRMRLVRRILTKKPAYPSDTKQVYSNAGFAIAGAMIEQVMDQAYEELLREHLFAPLGMDSAGFRAPATNGVVDQPYGHCKKWLKRVSVDPEPAGDNPVAIAPAGAVHCSIGDFAKYALFHLGHTEKRPLSEKMLHTLHTPEKGRDYAMGWSVVTRDWAGGTTLTHSGSNTMFYAVIWIAPEKNFAAVALSNDGGKDAFSKCDEAIGLLIRKALK